MAACRKPYTELNVSPRVRNLLFAAAAPLVLGLLAWSFVGGESPFSTPATEVESAAPPGRQDPPQPTAVTSPSAVTSHVSEGDSVSRREYALGLHELSGLPADVPTGTHIELWVAWDPPITDEPKVQRLIRDVVVSKVIPPVTPEGPHAVIVSVPLDRMSDLIYGDRYGSLSALILPSGSG
jgi:hypothetical protein